MSSATMRLARLVSSGRIRWQALAARLGRGGVRALITGVAASVVGYMASGLLGTVASAMIVRQLGPDRYGDYSLLLTSLSLLGSVLGFGLDTWVLKDGGRAPERLSHNVYQVLLLKLIGAGLLLVILAVGWSNHVQYTAAFLVGVVGIVLSSFAQTGYAALRATRRNGQVAALQTLEPALLLATLLLASGASLTVLLLMIVRVVCSALLFVVLMRQVWQVCGHARGTFAPLPVIRGAWLFVTADVLANVYGQAVFAVLGITAGAALVGLVRPAVELLLLIQTVPNLLFFVALPLLSAAQITRREFLNQLAVMALGAALYGIAASVGLWIIGERALVGLYGPEYRASLPYLLTLSAVPLLKAGSLVFAAVMLSRDQVKLRVAAQSIVALLSVALAWLLVPAYGANGAVWTILATEVTICALYAIGAAAALRRAFQ